VLEIVDERPQGLIEALAQRVVGVVADFHECALDGRDDLEENLPIHRRWHPPRRLTLHPIADDVVILLHGARDQDDRFVEQLLVAVVFGDDGQQLARDRRDARLSDAVLDAPVDQRLDVLVSQHLRARRQRLRSLTRDGARVFGVGNPSRETFPDVQAAQTSFDDLSRQEVALDERSERAADAVLSRWNNGGVRDRYPERVAEERRDREPVREPAHHRGFGRRAHETQPCEAGLQQARDEVHDGC
jgi:hypothetical protein